MDVVDEPRDEQKEIKENEADAPADVKQEHEPEPLQEQDQAQAQAQAQEQTQEQAQPQSQEQDAPPASELAASSTEDVVLPSGEAPEQATEPQPSALSTASSLAADLSPGTMKPRWVLICFAITFCVYVALIPQLLVYSNPPTGDQVFYLMDVASIAQDLDLNIKNNYDNVDETKFYQLAPKPDGYVGMNGPYPLPRQLADSIRPIDTEQYAFHLPGLAVLLAPAWKIGSFFSLWWPATIVVLCIIGALVATNVFLLAYEVTNRHWIAWAVWLSLAFTVPIMTFSYMIFTELPMGLLVIYAFRRLALGWGSNSLWRLLLIGVCIGYIPWMAWRGLPLVFTLLVYAAIQWWRYRRALRVDAAAQTVGGDLTPIVPVENTTLPVRRPTPAISKRNNSGSILSTAWLLVPIGISAVILGSYHMFLYNRLTPDTKVPELGDLLPFHWPWAGLDEAANFAKGAFAIFFDKQFGLLMYAPIYLLAVVGIIAMFRSAQPTHRNLLWGMALVVLPYLGVIMAFEFWHGIWCPPARYLATLVPFAGGPLAVSLLAFAGTRLGWIYKFIYAFLSAISLIISAILMYDSQLMWPEPYPTIWVWLIQQSPVHWDLTPWLTDYVNPDDLLHPKNSALGIVVAVGIVLLCYLIMMFQRGQWSKRKLSLPLHGLIWMEAIIVVGLVWFAMSYQYLKPKTILTEIGRWPIDPALSRPAGMTYLDGKVYITDWDKATVGAFDVASGTYQPITPVSGQGSVAFTHPGAVKVGPDKLLYVLNNGGGQNDMYVMKPTGEVVRRIALDGRTVVSLGLDFGPDGRIYVADMVGAKISRYDPEGGNPVNSWSGMSGGYNNIQGVTVGPDGMIYGLESSYQRVQQFDPTGRFIRKYPIGCRPSYAAVNGDWLDVACHSGLKSINLKDHYVQYSKTRNGDRYLTGESMTYGPGNIIFMITGTSLVEYRVQH